MRHKPFPWSTLCLMRCLRTVEDLPPSHCTQSDMDTTITVHVHEFFHPHQEKYFFPWQTRNPGGHPPQSSGISGNLGLHEVYQGAQALQGTPGFPRVTEALWGCRGLGGCPPGIPVCLGFRTFFLMHVMWFRSTLMTRLGCTMVPPSRFAYECHGSVNFFVITGVETYYSLPPLIGAKWIVMLRDTISWQYYGWGMLPWLEPEGV